ncbi:MAG: PfkB family carbohydrate kinase [Anaerolineae bacterium]
MAARLGAQVSVVTKLGRDTFGEETLFNFRHQGIDTTHVLFDERLASGVALIAVDEQTGQNSIVMVPGANDALRLPKCAKPAKRSRRRRLCCASLKSRSKPRLPPSASRGRRASRLCSTRLPRPPSPTKRLP